MKKTILAVSLAALTLPALAQTAPEPDLTIEGNVGLFSDYRFRGISQTDLKPALQGGFDLTHKSGFYIGTWASNVSDFANFGGGNGMEIDGYVGYTFEVGDIGVDIGNLYYYYPGSSVDPGDPKPNTNEIYVGLTYGPVTLKTSYSTTNYFGFADSKGTLYYDLSASHPLTDTITLNAHVGYVDIKNDVSGTDYKIGVSTEFAGLTFAADYVGNSGKLSDSVSGYTTNSGKVVDLGKSAVVLSVSKTF
jgi:uncharacterized protein (TIGR02001 family)